jgi:hypothetical protein
VNFVLFSFSSNHFSCGRKKFREREREREREKEKVIDWNRSKLIYYLDYSTFFQRGKNKQLTTARGANTFKLGFQTLKVSSYFSAYFLRMHSLRKEKKRE